MLILNINIINYFDKVLSHARQHIVQISSKFTWYFENVRKNCCRIGNERYKVGEVWAGNDMQWRICQPGGNVQVYDQPISLYDRCKETLFELIRTASRLHRKHWKQEPTGGGSELTRL